MNHLPPELIQHLREDERFQDRIEKILDNINLKLDNHITHIASDIGGIKTAIEFLQKKQEERRDIVKEESKDDIKTQTDVDWLKRVFWAFALPAIGAFILGIINLYKN